MSQLTELFRNGNEISVNGWELLLAYLSNNPVDEACDKVEELAWEHVRVFSYNQMPCFNQTYVKILLSQVIASIESNFGDSIKCKIKTKKSAGEITEYSLHLFPDNGEVDNDAEGYLVEDVSDFESFLKEYTGFEDYQEALSCLVSEGYSVLKGQTEAVVSKLKQQNSTLSKIMTMRLTKIADTYKPSAEVTEQLLSQSGIKQGIHSKTIELTIGLAFAIKEFLLELDNIDDVNVSLTGVYIDITASVNGNQVSIFDYDSIAHLLS